MERKNDKLNNVIPNTDNEDVGDDLQALGYIIVDQDDADDGSCNIENTIDLTSEETEEGNKKPKPRLSGAGRKRYKWWREQGYSIEKARELAIKPMNPYTRSTGNTTTPKLEKATYYPSSTQTSQHTENIRLNCNKTIMSKKSKTDESILSTHTVNKNVKMCVLSEDYPGTHLNTNQLTTIRSCILEQIVLQKGSTIKPRFLASTFAQGFLIITCADTDTINWLRHTVAKLSPWTGAKLMAMEEHQIPQPVILTGAFPDSVGDTDEKIIGFVEAQNNGLNVSRWKILNRVTAGTSLNLTLSVDRDSVDNLKKQDFMLSYKFGQIRLSVEQYPSAHHSEDTSFNPQRLTSKRFTKKYLKNPSACPSVNRNWPPRWESNKGKNKPNNY